MPNATLNSDSVSDGANVMALQLEPCAQNAPNQMFRVFHELNSTSIAATISGVDVPCGKNGVKQNEFWSIKEDTIASLQPNTPFCFAAAVGGASATLADCSSSDAEFNIGFTATTNGTIVHKASGKCITAVGKPPSP
eukprot:gene8546-29858_t